MSIRTHFFNNTVSLNTEIHVFSRGGPNPKCEWQPAISWAIAATRKEAQFHYKTRMLARSIPWLPTDILDYNIFKVVIVTKIFGALIAWNTTYT